MLKGDSTTLSPGLNNFYLQKLTLLS